MNLSVTDDNNKFRIVEEGGCVLVIIDCNLLYVQSAGDVVTTDQWTN